LKNKVVEVREKMYHFNRWCRAWNEMTNSSAVAATAGCAAAVPQQQHQQSSALWHGLGLFGESYLLFSIGTLRPLWEALYPLCFSSSAASSCPRPYLTYNSLSYSVVLGVMLGMVVVGSLAGRIGRRNGSLLTASIMVGGASALTLASVLLSGDGGDGRPDVLFMVMSASLFVFGIGVGGEYPLSASLASERAMAAMNERRRLEEQEEGRITSRTLGEQAATDFMSSRLLTASHNGDNVKVKERSSNIDHHHSWQITRSANMKQIEHYSVTQQAQSSFTTTARKQTNQNNKISSKTLTRGREVIFVFSMQGLGIFANSIILTFLLMLTKRKVQQEQQQQQLQGDDNYDYSSGYINQYHDQITLLYIWRIIYAIGLAILIYVLLSRMRHLTESEVWTQERLRRDEELQGQRWQQLGGCRSGEEEGKSDGFVPPSLIPPDGRVGEENRQQQQQQQQQQQSETQLLFKHYGIRLFGTSITWLLWDIGE